LLAIQAPTPSVPKIVVEQIYGWRWPPTAEERAAAA